MPCQRLRLRASTCEHLSKRGHASAAVKLYDARAINACAALPASSLHMLLLLLLLSLVVL
eukprot:15453014-Alexandrium_andersonii.AAC.1